MANWFVVHQPTNTPNKTLINNGTISQSLNLSAFHFIFFEGTTTNLTIDNNVSGTSTGGPSGRYQNGLIAVSGSGVVGGTITNNANLSVDGVIRRGLVVDNRAILQSFVNNSVFEHTGSNSLIYVRGGGTIQNITNNGEMSINAADIGWKSVIRLEDAGNLTGARVDAINFIGNSTTSNVNSAGTKWNVISIGSATSSIGTITARDSATIDGHFSFDQGTIGNITFQDSANMTGNISLANSAKITNGITIRDSGTIAGNISLAGRSAITNGITIGGNSTGGSGNNASLTGNISLAGQSSISKILIDGSNSSGANGTPKVSVELQLTMEV